MTFLEPQTGDIPLPEPTVETQPFWEGCARGELRFQRCAACGRANFIPVVRCRFCLSPEVSWEVSSGKGAIYTWSAAWRPSLPAFTTPYVVAIVELDEGYQMLSNIVGCEVAEVRIGLPVTVEFHPTHGGIVLPYFRPLSAGTEATQA